MDEDKIIGECNPAFMQLFGYSAEEIIGANIDSLVTPEFEIEDAAKAKNEKKLELAYLVNEQTPTTVLGDETRLRHQSFSPVDASTLPFSICKCRKWMVMA
jgi:PAS domain S-box-containing protein